MALEYMDHLKNDNYYINKVLSDIEIIKRDLPKLKEALEN